MALSGRDRAVAAVAGGIAAYSLSGEGRGASMYDHVLRAAPEDARGGITAELIDEVFEYVASARAREGRE